MSILSLHHVCIQTEDYQESLKFYIDILGFKLVSETANFHGRDYNTWLAIGTCLIELQTAKKSEKLNFCRMNSTGIVHMCFKVDNINRELDRLLKVGANVIKKDGKMIYKVENGFLFKIKAPEGTIIEFRDTEM